MKQVLCSKCKQRPAMFFITKVEGDKSTQEGLCMKCAMEMNIGPIKQMMQSMGISEDDVDSIAEQYDEMMEDGSFEPGGAGTMPFMQNFFSQMEKKDEQNEPAEEKKKHKKKEKSDKKDKKERKFLSMYCTDLTEKARNGQLDRIIGREKEIERTVQILCRRSKNNPCLIGEPGVGKTAIAEGLALRIAAGNVPVRLLEKEIHLLDLTALVAGTQFR
ncbi:MAG: ATP-dependent Clp protease ATP-binding subunit, partial [Oscillospiraceae bacterium]|nr:ATP-dependent Clp protease ATP-binding subunit [Oscillospiraceae bacterium]